ncbi:MAG: oxygen-independent coproporphyrinogen III oxidase [candidate division Zixibacteria bacterium RBG_16_53_22]|nr:MAG: oxygen-independent coproporphyrinogen III oxidase [candidate division Zixibacteria bacterium RBG_16_53_22]
MSEQINQVRIAELVKKYDQAGPRYTSYPTAPEWSDQYAPDDYMEALKVASNSPGEPLSFYLHIPFCRKRCWFCGCTTMVVTTPDAIDRYLDRVELEVAMVADRLGGRKKVSQFHWGGGTPSFLTDAQTIRAFELFTRKFEILGDAEVSIELDPRTTTRECVKLLKKLGFNRLSMGVQDFMHDVQEAIGRHQDSAMTISLYEICRTEGFESINFDLIYGLPKQSLAGFGETLDRTIGLRPDRVALFSYAHLPQRQPNQRSIDPAALPSAQLKSELFGLARQRFLDNGYVQIGMDHFVLFDDELALAASHGKLRRNFMGYTVNAAKDWLGIGMSSISYVSDNFAQNKSEIDGYSAAIDIGHFATYRGQRLSKDDLIRQYAIMEIMCNFRLDFAEADRRFGIDTRNYLKSELIELLPLMADGLLVEIDGGLEVTPIGRLFVRNIAVTFDTYLKKVADGKARAQFSRTI